MTDKPVMKTEKHGNKFWWLNGKLHREDGPACEYADGTKFWWLNGKLHREDGPAVEYGNGNKRWYLNGKLHREDGPAVKYGNGDKSWYLNDKLHREDGPAVEWAEGYKSWWLNGELHREDGPAIEWANGSKSWYLNGKYHREDGPAIEYADGTKSWYLNGEWVTEDEVMGKSKDNVNSPSAESDGGPSSYYDMPFQDWVTLNDQMEYLAQNKWGVYAIHLKDVFKGLGRWGDKSGTTPLYDTKKGIYYFCRVMKMMVGVEGLREYLQSILDDPQFKEKNNG